MECFSERVVGAIKFVTVFLERSRPLIHITVFNTLLETIVSCIVLVSNTAQSSWLALIGWTSPFLHLAIALVFTA